MDERPVQCEFFVPIVRNSDKQPHQPTAWNLITDASRRYLLAIPASRVELRQLLRRAENSFDQKAVYLSVKGDVEFLTAAESDGFLG